MLLFSFLVAAVAALSIPRSSTHSKHLDFRAVGGSQHHVHSRYHSLIGPAHLKTRDGNATTSLTVHIENNLEEPVHAYITGKSNANGKFVVVKVASDGKSSFIDLPTAPASTNGVNITGLEPITIPPGGRDITLTQYIISARLYISKETSPEASLRFRANIDGSNVPSLEQPDFLSMTDPAFNIMWGFMEFNYSPTELFVNLSFVDFVSLALGMSMKYKPNANSGEEQTATIGGLHKDAVNRICDELNSLGGPWAKLCYQPDGAPEAIRVIAPEKYMSGYPGREFDTYYDNYVNQVWEQYTTKPLTFDTQDDQNGHPTANGLEIPCQVNGTSLMMDCNGVNGTVASFPKPTSRDIFGCSAKQDSGTFAHVDADPPAKKEIIARLCAGFSRSTLLKNDHPMEVAKISYYDNDVTNHYARLVHDNLVDGRGYAFPYDDVNMDPTDPDENTAGIIQQANPVQLTITVGGEAQDA